MNSTSVAPSAEALTASQRAALISLLADDDQNVYHTIRSKIISYGPVATEWLQPYTLSSDPVLRRRAQEIAHLLSRRTADERFLAFCLHHGEELDVEEGAWLFARTCYPEINIAAYQALFDSYAAELRERIDLKGEAEHILATINQYLFDHLGFAGNEKNFNDPENSYLNRVVDNRAGIPISMCLVYLLIARRLRLPITGIGMPGHFLCRYQSPTAEIYIDAFNRGKFLTKADCIKYLLHTNHGLQEGYLAPVAPRRILLRMCANLHQIYLQLELSDEASRLQRYLVALAK